MNIQFQVSLDENTPETPLRMYSRKVAGLELFSITVQYKDDSADLLSHYTVSLTSSLVWRQVGGRLSLHYRYPVSALVIRRGYTVERGK